ncbi:hypothetical protein [Streptomyces coelicoflavus]|uniref:hypothetical protein n=1 Tax=Streptomyces coelicoflavus TaxID=285562 RepID=UPI0036BDAC78
MRSKYTKRYTEEFKRDAMALADSSGRSLPSPVSSASVSESLRGWKRRARQADDNVLAHQITVPHIASPAHTYGVPRTPNWAAWDGG